MIRQDAFLDRSESFQRLSALGPFELVDEGVVDSYLDIGRQCFPNVRIVCFDIGDISTVEGWIEEELKDYLQLTHVIFYWYGGRRVFERDTIRSDGESANWRYYDLPKDEPFHHSDLGGYWAPNRHFNRF